MTERSAIPALLLPNEMVRIADLVPHAQNARLHDDDVIRASLDGLGLYRPVVVNRGTLTGRPNEILAGHGTAKNYAASGNEWIQVSYVDVDDDQARRILIVDNRANDLAEYDDQLLADLLQSLPSLDFTGFDNESLDELLDSITDDDTIVDPVDPDAIPDEAAPRASRGQIWQLGPHRVMCGSATDADDMTALIDGAMIDCVLTDPPYGMALNTDYSYHRGKHPAARPVIGDDCAYNAEPVRAQLALVKEQFWFGADYYRRSLTDDDRDGSWLVWDKRSAEMDDVFGSGFELIWSARAHQRSMLRCLWVGFAADGVVSRSEASGRLHPTQKPTELLREIITRWTDENAIIIDPYGGSGSTLIAAHATNRVALLMEIDPRYVDTICARFEAITGETARLLHEDLDEKARVV